MINAVFQRKELVRECGWVCVAAEIRMQNACDVTCTQKIDPTLKSLLHDYEVTRRSRKTGNRIFAKGPDRDTFPQLKRAAESGSGEITAGPSRTFDRLLDPRNPIRCSTNGFTLFLGPFAIIAVSHAPAAGAVAGRAGLTPHVPAIPGAMGPFTHCNIMVFIDREACRTGSFLQLQLDYYKNNY
ncbi:hypothetical protein EVAR_102111_1 [Eumeta japonica]|uniref:Uncharacterized protein n=1 Tax=Eumeta variegata TaxID=151549 RepID=A0A4C1TZP9_EUMVA|nr:hypothetical protein EVAR_102111_1 [Eumeta japonica]